MTIYNSADLTLVREIRNLTIKKEANFLQFAWENTLIDPTSLQMLPKASADKLQILDLQFPARVRNLGLWSVTSALDGRVPVEITYLTSGLSWRAFYMGTLSPDETKLHLTGHVRVQNNSGEDYENAQTRLIVGTVHLLDQIAALAQQQYPYGSPLPLPMEKAADSSSLRSENKPKDMPALGLVMAEESRAYFAGADKLSKKEIVKEGLSEYFLYTIEGTETIRNGWSKRMRSFEGQTVPFRIQYRYRPAEYGDQLVRMYLLTNDKQSKLGTTPLPDGTVRVFRQNERAGLSYLTQQQVKYIPIGDKIELNLGPDREVLFELVKLRTWRDTVWMQVQGADIFRQVDQPGIEIEVNSAVSGWDDHTLFAQRVRNYSGKAIDLEIRRTLPGHVVFRSQLPAKNFDFQTVEYTATVPAGKKVDLLYELVQRQGRNAKQNNVTIEATQVE